MPIIDQEKLDVWIKSNTDAYGGCCVAVAKEVMRMLDIENEPLIKGYYPVKNTAHGMICRADDNIEAGGITGFMAGAVAQMVRQCHSRGEEFWNSYHKV